MTKTTHLTIAGVLTLTMLGCQPAPIAPGATQPSAMEGAQLKGARITLTLPTIGALSTQAAGTWPGQVRAYQWQITLMQGATVIQTKTAPTHGLQPTVELIAPAGDNYSLAVAVLDRAGQDVTASVINGALTVTPAAFKIVNTGTVSSPVHAIYAQSDANNLTPLENIAITGAFRDGTAAAAGPQITLTRHVNDDSGLLGIALLNNATYRVLAKGTGGSSTLTINDVQTGAESGPTHSVFVYRVADNGNSTTAKRIDLPASPGAAGQPSGGPTEITPIAHYNIVTANNLPTSRIWGTTSKAVWWLAGNTVYTNDQPTGLTGVGALAVGADGTTYRYVINHDAQGGAIIKQAPDGTDSVLRDGIATTTPIIHLDIDGYGNVYACQQVGTDFQFLKLPIGGDKDSGAIIRNPAAPANPLRVPGVTQMSVDAFGNLYYTDAAGVKLLGKNDRDVFQPPVLLYASTGPMVVDPAGNLYVNEKDGDHWFIHLVPNLPSGRGTVKYPVMEAYSPKNHLGLSYTGELYGFSTTDTWVDIFGADTSGK